jgi:hypothetical protein
MPIGTGLRADAIAARDPARETCSAEKLISCAA